MINDVLARFARLSGATDTQISGSAALDQLTRKISGSDQLTRTRVLEIASSNKTVSFMVVRNPLDRVVSAYRWVG